ncbi:MAG TPA: SDR family oxidoreductase [Gemmatimonadales bacterium]|nr:SDR family oxidoreductase [Gemmatimonadales bacterium]
MHLERSVKFQGRTCLVTGAGRRVGRAIALAVGAEGARVAVHYNESDEGASEVVKLLRDSGTEAQAFSADLTRPDAPEALISAVHQWAGLDFLVNSAAVMMEGPVDSVSQDEWEFMFTLNLRAPFFLSQAAARVMKPGSAMVNIADLAAFETWPNHVPHGITKAGVVQMTRALARVLAPGIRVNAVAPGAVLLPESMDQESAERLAATTPLGRIGSAEDVAEAVCYLLGAGYVTGEVIVVDGGRLIRK